MISYALFEAIRLGNGSASEYRHEIDEEKYEAVAAEEEDRSRLDMFESHGLVFKV